MTSARDDGMGQSVKRAEWGVVASLVVSVLTLVFTGGVVYGQVQSQDARIVKLERNSDDAAHQLAAQAVTISRIDANVGFLTDQARERGHK